MHSILLILLLVVREHFLRCKRTGESQRYSNVTSWQPLLDCTVPSPPKCSPSTSATRMLIHEEGKDNSALSDANVLV